MKRLILTLTLAATLLVAAPAATAEETIHATVEARTSCTGVEQRVREEIYDTEAEEVVEVRYTAWRFVSGTLPEDVERCRAIDRIGMLEERVDRLKAKVRHLRSRLQDARQR